MACRSTLRLAINGELYYGKVYPEGLNVPCGKCVPCKKRRVNDWVFRMKQEDKVSSASLFVTLTYSDEHLTYTSDKYPTLVQKDFQNFMKRLRKLTKNKLRYYAVGEYGDTYKRPHFHIILFNLEDEENLPIAWTCPTTKTLIGNIHSGQVTSASIAYTTKYIDKETKVPIHRYDKRLPEFSNMSQGLGKNYHENKEIRKYHQEDIQRVYVTYPDGKKIALPRYYRKKLYTKKQQLVQNDYIVKKIEENEKSEYYEYTQKYNIEDYSYTTWKATRVIGEYKRFYHKGKRADNITTDTLAYLPNTINEETHEAKGKLQINNTHRRKKIDFTEYDNTRPISNDSTNITKTHEGSRRHGI